MKKTVYILIVLVVCFSCQRRGGGTYNRDYSSRSTTTENRHSTVAERHRRTTDTEVERNSPSIPSQRTSNNIYTGAELFEKYSSAVFMVYTQDALHVSQGSAFFISSSGLAVSNYHVFESTYQGQEEFHMSDGSVYKLKNVVAKSKENDIFIFEVDGSKSFNYIPLSSRKPKVGERIFTIGSPKGLENTFSSGEISQLRGESVIQISAPIDHGSSGGVLLNEYGEAIGITSAGMDDSGANLNFAISTDLVKEMLR